MTYRIDGRGTITLRHRVDPDGSRLTTLPYLPRVGVRVKVPDSMRGLAYYGKGPHETYNDRAGGAFTGVWRGEVDDEYVRYPRPQAHGNHTDSRWLSLNDGRAAGLLVDEMGGSGSVAFGVWVDGQRRAATGVLTGAGGAEAVSADLTGGELLELRITDGGNGNGADHGDWAAARLACAPA